MEKYSIKELANRILEREKLTDWKIEWSVDLECSKEAKVIYLPHEETGNCIYYTFEKIVHEVAHALDNRENLDSGWESHDTEFYNLFARLMWRHADLVDHYNIVQLCQLKNKGYEEIKAEHYFKNGK